MTRSIRPSEHAEQQAVIQWWDHACKSYKLPPYSLFSVPNAGKRSYAAAAWMRSEGLRKGVPDLFLAVPRTSPQLWANLADLRTRCGLWIELKVGRNKPSSDQLHVMGYLRCNYAVEVCYSADEAIEVIKRYLA